MFLNLFFYVTEVVELYDVLGIDGIVAGLGKQCPEENVAEIGKEEMPEDMKDQTVFIAFIMDDEQKGPDQQNGEGRADECGQAPEQGDNGIEFEPDAGHVAALGWVDASAKVSIVGGILCRIKNILKFFGKNVLRFALVGIYQ